MSANFYKKTTAMFGIDMHPLDSSVSEPHVVFSAYSMNEFVGKRTKTVFADGLVMIQEGCSMIFIPHIADPKTEPGAGRLLATILGSSSKPFLAAHSVHANGAALACAMKGVGGLNVNCNSPRNLPTGGTLTIGTVVTQPTDADYAVAAATIAWGWLSSWGLNKLRHKLSFDISKLSERAQQAYKIVEKAVWKAAKTGFEKQVVNPGDKINHYVQKVFR